VKGFEQNKVGRCLAMCHNTQCEECGWVLLPPFLLQGSVNRGGQISKIMYEEANGSGEAVAKIIIIKASRVHNHNHNS
jgi:hypothetical protein